MKKNNRIMGIVSTAFLCTFLVGMAGCSGFDYRYENYYRPAATKYILPAVKVAVKVAFEQAVECVKQGIEKDICLDQISDNVKDEVTFHLEQTFEF